MKALKRALVGVLFLAASLCAPALAQQVAPITGPPQGIDCAYNSSLPTLTSGFQGWVQCDSQGKLYVPASQRRDSNFCYDGRCHRNASRGCGCRRHQCRREWSLLRPWRFVDHGATISRAERRLVFIHSRFSDATDLHNVDFDDDCQHGRRIGTCFRRSWGRRRDDRRDSERPRHRDGRFGGRGHIDRSRRRLDDTVAGDGVAGHCSEP